MYSRVLICLLAFALISCSGAGYRLRGHGSIKPVYHRVQGGETLSQIAKRYNVRTDSLVWLNGFNPFTTLQRGERILVSYGSGPVGHHTVSGSSRVSSGHSHGHGHSSSAAASSSGSTSQTLRDGSTVYLSDKLFWPAAAGKLSSGFGKRWGRHHDGIDIAAPTGTNVYAATSGEVIYSSNGLKGYGNLVIVRAASGMLTVYAHNDRIFTRVGQRVVRGEKIAEIGSTGKSTGPHLHFEVRVKRGAKGYAAVDPLPFFRASAEPARFRTNNSLSSLLGKRKR